MQKHLRVAPLGACPLAPPASGHAVPTALAAPPARRGRPPERRAARLGLELDRRRRMG